jgi:UDP-N-acetylglucosamine acyltransferase
MAIIHPTAIVDPGAELADGVVIGPWCRIGGDVRIGDNTELQNGVVIDGNARIGRENRIFSYAVIGTAPQDLKYRGEPTVVEIGDRNTIREFVTVNRSATLDEPVRVGSDNLLMAYAHIAHNCQIGDNVIIANAVNLAGHVHIMDYVTIGGMTAVHQFAWIGRYAFIGGASGVKKDVPPYTRGEGFPYRLAGLNAVGLRRKGFSAETVEAIKEIYRIIYHAGLNVSQALETVSQLSSLTPEQQEFVDFVKNSHRGIARARSVGHSDED